MKKILKWGAIILVLFFVFVTMVGFMTGDSETAFDETQAISKIKTYSFATEIKGKLAERYLDQYFKELTEKVPGVEEGEWEVNEASGVENGFYVVYKYKSAGGYNNPKWLVTEEKIVAVDDESRLITPDLAPEGYDQKDELIYDSFNGHLSKLMDSKPSSTAEQMDTIYEEAYQLTAEEYEITVDEVKEAIERNQKANSVK